MWSVSQFVVNLGVLEHLMRFVEIQNELLDKEVFWLISNVLAGTQEHIQVSNKHSSVLIHLIMYYLLVSFHNCRLVHLSKHQ